MPKPPRRRPPTIDLEATEISVDSPGGSEPPVGSDPGVAPDTPASEELGQQPGGVEPVGPPPEASGEQPGGVAPPPDLSGPPLAGVEPTTGDAVEAEPAAADAAVPPDAGSAGRERGVRPAIVLAAGVAGASITALAYAALWGAGLIPPSTVPIVNREDTAALGERIALIDRQVRELATRPESQASAPMPAPSASPAQLDGIEARLAKLESAASAPPAPPPAPDPALASRLATLDQRINAATVAAHDAATHAEAAVQAAEKAGSARPAASSVRGEVDALAGRVGALEQGNKTLEQGVKTLEQRLTRIGTATAADRAVRLGLAAMELRMAVERGAPFAAELAAAKLLAPDPALLAPLDALAGTGVPAPGALAQSLSALAPAMLKAAGPPSREGSVLERLEQSAGRLVRIRPVEEVPGDDPGTVVARAEVKATRGDLAGAVSELERLPADVQAPAAGWIKTAKTRIAAVDAARLLSAGALGALGPTAQ